MLTAIAHAIDRDTGVAQVTYDALEAITDRSRAKVAAGIKILVERKLVLASDEKRSLYALADYNTVPWAKFPVRGLYPNGDQIDAFRRFTLRHQAELDAMKLYFLIASRRDSERNAALLSYETIMEYTGILRANIRRAKSLLVANNLIHVDTVQKITAGLGVMNGYRLAHLDAFNHAGNTGRRLFETDVTPGPADQL